MTKHVKREQPWQHLAIASFPGEAGKFMEESAGFVGVFRNNLYQVTVRDIVTDLGDMLWLAIVRLNREAVHDWRHIQLIKNDIGGPESEAVELYPAESRLVDTNNQYHLWILPKGQALPFGYAERDIGDIPFGKNRQRAFVDVPKDLNEKRLELSPMAELFHKMKVRE